MTDAPASPSTERPDLAREGAWRPITMQDVRLCAGEGNLTYATILQAVNAIAVRREAEAAGPRSPSVSQDEPETSRISALEGELEEARKLVSQYATEAGEAKGRLEMSEAAGIVDGWRERALAAETALAYIHERLSRRAF